MLIGLKGDNYYSKVFKRVNYKLWNSTFWVVITYTTVLASKANVKYQFFSLPKNPIKNYRHAWSVAPEIHPPWISEIQH